MERRIFKLGRLRVCIGTLQGNHHGPDRSTLRSTWLVVDMGINPNTAGWRIYRYAADGSSRHIDLLWQTVRP